MNILWIGLGGFLGAVLRYALSQWSLRWWGNSFPYGTLLVNLLGCFLIGGLMVVFKEKGYLSEEWRFFLVVGMLGALTTFSTFSYETMELWNADKGGLSVWNVALNVCGCLGAVQLGRWSAERLF